ncbi:hypothetical protein [Kitasatospora sp. NPDC094011]|uniref:hypothetical protein n=1 Tax=Kitasatospora sp. NPDC094011 TaxID=3364090 RepID=UPI003821D127
MTAVDTGIGEATTHSAAERRYLRTAAKLGVALPLGPLIMVAIGGIPYPHDNVDGQTYVDYMFPHHIGELQTYVYLFYSAVMLAFVILLAAAYMQRAGRVTASGILMVSGITAYIGTQMAVVGFYMGILLWGRGYPSFGSDPADLRLISFVWGTLQVIYLASAVLAGVTWTAVALANRTPQLLPPVLGTRGALLVAAVQFAVLGTLFITRGPWSPGSILQYTVQTLASFLWITATSVFLLRKTRS